jgi:hypothetical protein
MANASEDEAVRLVFSTQPKFVMDGVSFARADATFAGTAPPSAAAVVENYALTQCCVEERLVGARVENAPVWG